MLRKILHNLILFTAFAVCCPGFAGDKFFLKGTVYFGESTDIPGAYSTVYIPEMKSGTTVSPEGNFVLDISNAVSPGTLKVEFSCIGYETVVKEILLDGPGDYVLEPLFLRQQNLMLPAAYVLPGYRNAADYILEQLSIKAAENRKKYTTYSMEIDYDFHTHELPLAADLVSKFVLGTAKAATGLMGFGPLVKYALANEDVSASVSFDRKIVNGKAYDSNVRLTSSSTELPEKVRKNVLDASGIIDLAGLIYSDECLWGRNHYGSYKFNHIGSYQWGDYMVDVLRWTDKRGKLSATVHVVEEIWGILKVEAGYDDKMVRCEARDIGNGFFLPVSLTVTPSFFPVIKAEKVQEYIERIQSENRLDKAAKKRIISVLENHKDKDIHPYIVGSFSVRYK